MSPYAGELLHPDDEAEQCGEQDGDRGQHDRIQQCDHEHIAVGRGVAVADQFLRASSKPAGRERNEKPVLILSRTIL